MSYGTWLEWDKQDYTRITTFPFQEVDVL